MSLHLLFAFRTTSRDLNGCLKNIFHILLGRVSVELLTLSYWKSVCTEFFKKYILLIMLLQLFQFFPFIPFCPTHPLPPTFPHLSSCPWVVHISSLASPFPILFLTFPCLFCTYYLCYLFSVPFSPFSSLPLPAENPPCDLHFCDSVPVLVA